VPSQTAFVLLNVDETASIICDRCNSSPQPGVDWPPCATRDWPCMQCVECNALNAQPTSRAPHAELIPGGFNALRGTVSELTYRCKRCGTSWHRRVPAFSPGRLPAPCLDHGMKCTACKNLFDEPTIKPAHDRLMPDSVGILHPPGDLNYRCKDCSTRWVRPLSKRGTRKPRLWFQRQRCDAR